MEYMVSRCEQHPGSVREDDRLQHIDQLRDVRHLHAVAVLVEYVEREPCHERVAHGILLIQESRIRPRLAVKPRTPLVADQSDLLLGIIPIHDRSVHLDQILYIKRLVECLIPGLLVKLRSAALVVPSAWMRVIVQ